MSRWGQSWLVLVSPTATWRQLEGGPWPALLTQAALIFIAWLASAKPMADLARTSGLGEGGTGLGSLIVLILALWLVTAVLAGILLLLLRGLDSSNSFATILTWLVFGLTPIYLGRCLGLLSFAVFQPLANNRADALALQMNPLSLSLAPAFKPLSLPWTIAASLDIFALWALVLLALGTLHYLKLSAARTSVLLGALLIIWLLALTAMWQGLQRSL